MIILGVDPSLNATGFGFIKAAAGKLQVVTAGDVRPPGKGPLPERLGFLHVQLSHLLARYRPGAVAIEQVFTHHRYVSTAALMAHARGVTVLVVHEHGLPVAEYSPAAVKKSLTGSGRATKEQVARMVGHWLGRRDASWSADATDALALAIAHAHVGAQRRHLPSGAGRG